MQSAGTRLVARDEKRAEAELEELYRRRSSDGWFPRLRRKLEPPAPFIMNPDEPTDFPLGRWNLYIGGAGQRLSGYVNLDLIALSGVDVAADAARLPFGSDLFQRVECDAVLEHVREPCRVVAEIRRVLAPGGYVHFVTPFCHPYHGFPGDYRRFTVDGLKLLVPDWEVVAEGWRTGPTATLLIMVIEYVKLLLPYRAWRALAHFVCGWALFPLRYLDLWLLRSPHAGRIGNHCYIWFRKPESL